MAKAQKKVRDKGRKNSVTVTIEREFYLVHNGMPFYFAPGQEWKVDPDVSYPGNTKTKTISPLLLEEYKNENIFLEK